jgi:hypothetical protein
MAVIKIQIKSNHEDGDSIENSISLTLEDAFFTEFQTNSEVNWTTLNERILEYPNYANLVKDEVRKNRIEIPDPYWWSTTGIVVGFNDQSMSEDFDFYLLDYKLITGDFLD